MSASNRSDIRIGLAGMGTVGGGVADLLQMNQDWIRQRTGRDVTISVVLEREAKRADVEQKLPGARFTTDPTDLTTAADVDVVVELVGGTTFACDLIVGALQSGKHVVTANKALLAERGEEVFPLAAEKGVHLGYEASVAGGIPVVQTLKETLAANRIDTVMGILNGTSNYILTAMSENDMEFAEALKMAQDLGYAEADPTLDIEGGDAAHKLTLLIQLAFGEYIPFKDIPVTGITVVDAMDIAYARDLGYQVKLIGRARKLEGKIEAGVFPALIPNNYMLASVTGSFNAIRLDGNAGPVLLYGYGAGDLPTASAVLADILAVAREAAPNNTGFAVPALAPGEMIDLDEEVSLHYLRFMAPDRPGVLRDVAGHLAEEGISLAQVIQKGEDTGDGVPIVFLTHEASARAVHNAMRAVEADGLTKSKTMHLRIL